LTFNWIAQSRGVDIAVRRQLDRALQAAGLAELATRALRGEGLGREDLAVLESADVLIVGALADAVRSQQRGEEVRVIASAAARRDPELVRLDLESRENGPTGEELLRKVALARLQAPASRGVAVSYEQLGLELAQVALSFGADALIGDLESKRALPLLGGSAARRTELQGLIERVGRRVRWIDAQPEPSAESRS
jgi:2-iminoacetate synthase ThiH